MQTSGRDVRKAATAVGRQALGVVASGCPQPAVAITSASIENLANKRRVLICMARIMIPCERSVLTRLYHISARLAKPLR